MMRERCRDEKCAVAFLGMSASTRRFVEFQLDRESVAAIEVGNDAAFFDLPFVVERKGVLGSVGEQRLAHVLARKNSFDGQQRKCAVLRIGHIHPNKSLVLGDHATDGQVVGILPRFVVGRDARLELAVGWLSGNAELQEWRDGLDAGIGRLRGRCS